MAEHRHTTRSSLDAWLQSASRHQPLSERTVLELARRIQRWQRHPAGPKSAPKRLRRSALRARDQLVHHNLRLVSHTWRRNRHLLPLRDEGTVDAMQEAALNLVRAAEKFDPSKGYTFSTYASFWLQRGFSDYLQRSRRMIRFPAEKAGLMLKAQRLIERQQQRTGEPPTMEWLASQLRFNGKNLGVEQLTTMLQQWRGTLTRSLDHPALGESTAGENGLLEQASRQVTTTAELQRQCETEAAHLKRWMGVLEPIEQRVLRNRYLRQPPLTSAQLRRSLPDLSASEIQTVEAQSLAKLREVALKRHQ